MAPSRRRLARRRLRVDVVVDPGHEHGDVGVDSGQAGARTADTPAHEADESATAALVERQRSATVTLWNTRAG